MGHERPTFTISQIQIGLLSGFFKDKKNNRVKIDPVI